MTTPRALGVPMLETRVPRLPGDIGVPAGRHDLRGVVLECTNMSPYADAVRAATGRDVQHLGSLLAARFAALA